MANTTWTVPTKPTLPPLVNGKTLTHRTATGISQATTQITSCLELDQCSSICSSCQDFPDADISSLSNLDIGSYRQVPSIDNSRRNSLDSDDALRHGFRRQIPEPVQVSMAEMCFIKIRNDVPNAIVSHINLGKKITDGGAEDTPATHGSVVVVGGPDDFVNAFGDGVPSFIFVDSCKESADLATSMLRSSHSSSADAIILVLSCNDAVKSDESIIDSVPDFIANGADDVIMMPTSMGQMPQLSTSLSLSMAKAKACRKRISGLTRELRDYKRQCHELFWSIAYVVFPGFPEVKNHLTECENRVGDVDLSQKLGEGQYGTVRTWKRGQEKGAVKIMPKKMFRSPEDVGQLAIEFESLQKIDHPHVVKARAIVHGMDNMYLFMDMAGTQNLFQMIRSTGKQGLPLGEALAIFVQIADAMAHCHSLQIAHCDLKPENVVISNEADAKIVDFGLAVDFAEEVPTLVAPRGTMPFMSPEIMRPSETWDPASTDVWALGVILLEMLCGNHAFANLLGWHSKEMMRGSQLKHRADDVNAFFANDGAEAREKAMMSVTKLCGHPTPCVVDLLFDILMVAPSERLNAIDIVQKVDDRFVDNVAGA